MASTSEFRALYHELGGQETSYELATFLESWAGQNATLMDSLAHHRVFDSTYSFERDELSSWYALSRISDFLLPYRPQQKTEHSWDVPVLDEENHSAFWDALQFTRFHPSDFHPFWCEIVEVEADANPDFAPQIVELFWPSLSFGDLLFARAGVRVRSGVNFIDAKIATSSPLYFSYFRQNRKTFDLSMGWGSNSQWSTDFRRDYVCGAHLLFNVDAERDFDLPPFLKNFDVANLKDRAFFASDKGDNDDLIVTEREELLTHHCFVQCTKNDDDLWPYDDCLVVRRDEVLY